jgi:hypothetical protein
MTMLLLLAAWTAAAAPAGDKPAEPAAVFSPERKPNDEPVAYAQAISLAFGTTFFAEVKISTNGAVVDLSRLAHEGFYKRELITLLLLCGKAKKPLQDAAAARKKGKTLRAIALSYGLDFDAVYDAALAVEEDVDRHYLPRFPERRPRKERDEP